MDTNLKGKVALVTGGGRDVGGDIARALAVEGATIAVNYARSKDEAQAVVQSIEAGGGRAKAYQADISDNAQVKAMVAAIKSDFGTVDILVNNAGYVKYQRFVDSTPDDWKKQIEVCLFGAINCCHEVAPMMIAQNSGKIINLVGDSSRIGEANLALAAAARRHDRAWQVACPRIRSQQRYRQHRFARPDRDLTFRS